MSDDLIKRLWILDMHPESAPRKAADEIERLRTALKNIIDDCKADYPPSHGAIKQFAHEALEGKT